MRERERLTEARAELSLAAETGRSGDGMRGGKTTPQSGAGRLSIDG